VRRSDEKQGGVALTIFTAPAGCDGPDTRVEAHVTIGAACVVVVPAPGTAYATHAGILRLVSALRAYQQP
jgi:hypothetical protein